jgi:hypothetical protein
MTEESNPRTNWPLLVPDREVDVRQPLVLTRSPHRIDGLTTFQDISGPSAADSGGRWRGGSRASRFSGSMILKSLVQTLALAVMTVAACSDSTAPGGDCNATRDIVIGTPAAGSLTRQDCHRDDNTFEDKWRLVIAAETEVQIDLSSEDFDTYLMLRDSDGVEIGADDDSGGMNNSRLVITLQPGTYIIAANSYFPLMTGGYLLSVTAVGG